jgi:phosphotransferase system enzyme I (PtsI)
MKDLPVTIRTLDIGGEKLAVALQNDVGSGPNPALGLRGVRLSLRREDLLETQLAAILRASLHGKVRVLVPMVVTVGEMTRVRQIYTKVADRLRCDGHALPQALARECEFFAIGTNDLTQYTLAIDRSDDQVAHLYDPLHPAILRLIYEAAKAAARTGIPMSVCGEMAGDPRYTPLFLGMGLRKLSMSPGSLLQVKQRVRRLDSRTSEYQAQQILDQWDPDRIAVMLDDFNDLA